MAPIQPKQEPPLVGKLASAGLAACVADALTFPLDYAKVQLQIQGEKNGKKQYSGTFDCLSQTCRSGGFRAMYKGLVPGLQRQMCFASVRIGLYDQVKQSYTNFFMGEKNGKENFGIRVLAGITTGGMAVAFAQPTDVVKVRMQAQKEGQIRYKGCVEAYSKIARKEGIPGLWKGTLPNMTRNAVVNTSELVTYDYIKSFILKYKLLNDNVPCHFVSAFGAGFITTICASPVDVVKTRYMNSGIGEYSGVLNCATSMFRNEGFFAFYKGFWPSFMRLGSWNIVMFITYEQFKKLVMMRPQKTTL